MRRLRVVASMALIVLLALVVVPGPAGSRVPNPLATADPDLFRPVEVLSLTRGTTTMIQPPDPGARSAGNLDERSIFIEPASRTEPPEALLRGARPAGAAQPAAKPGAIAIIQVRPAQTGATAKKPARTAQPVADSGVRATGPWHSAVASWYGPGFYGHHTACGQTLTRGLVGVAHKTLPCGTKVIFRNPSNGRTAVVPVVDRGPYIAGRTWDLTAGACQQLGQCSTGPIQWRLAGGG